MPKKGMINEKSADYLAGKAAGLNWAMAFCDGLARGEQTWANTSIARPDTHEYAALQLSHAASHISTAFAHVLAEAERERQRAEAWMREEAATVAKAVLAREAEAKRKGPSRRNRRDDGRG